MEKICIVKRRRRDLFPVPDTTEERDERNSPKDPPGPDAHAGRAGVISVELTPEQSRTIESRADLTPGKAFMVNLEEAEPESGRMVFSFRMVPLYGGKMLSPDEVCAMLRISKGSLAKLVRTRKIDSYRIGRLRRFLFEDILRYLGHSREFPENAP